MDRRICGVVKDRKGNIVALGHPGMSWSPRKVADVARDIWDNRQSYYVEQSGSRRYIRVVQGRVLQTTRDPKDPNSLTALPTL